MKQLLTAIKNEYPETLRALIDYWCFTLNKPSSCFYDNIKEINILEFFDKKKVYINTKYDPDPQCKDFDYYIIYDSKEVVREFRIPSRIKALHLGILKASEILEEGLNENKKTSCL